MKNLYSLLLGVLISSTNSSFLLAQSDNRLKATNQVIGYRLQVIGLETTGLLSEHNIGQGTKTTTNYNNQATGYRLQDRRQQNYYQKIRLGKELKQLRTTIIRLQVTGDRGQDRQ